MADIILADKLHKYSIRYEYFFIWITLPTLCLNMFRKQRRQRAQNATSATVAISTAGTLSAATPFHRHDTAGRIHSTAWTRSAHVHVRPRRRTSWWPVAAAMVWNKLHFTNFKPFMHFEMLTLCVCFTYCSHPQQTVVRKYQFSTGCIVYLYCKDILYRWMIMLCLFNVIAVALLLLFQCFTGQRPVLVLAFFENGKWCQFKAPIKIILQQSFHFSRDSNIS